MITRSLTLLSVVVVLAMCGGPDIAAHTQAWVGAATTSTPDTDQSALHTAQWALAEGGTMNYMVALPAGFSPDATYPMLVYLHGSGVHGVDITTYAESSHRIRPPAETPFIVLMPQMPTYSRWSFYSEAVLGLVEQVTADYPVDTNRIYMTGYSDGGYGALAIGATGADRFAAVLSGGSYWLGDAQPLCALAEQRVPVSLHHASLDTIIPFEQALTVEDHLMRCGADVSLIAYEGESHISAAGLIFGQTAIYEWLLQHQRVG